MKILEYSSKNEFYLAIFLIILFQLLMAFQGFDVCDDGFALTFFQQIFVAPESVEYNFVYWLSGIVGGLWYNIYPEGGVLWFRILTIIVTTITFIFSYKILKYYISNRNTLIGLAMVVFVNDFGFLSFYHNHLTALLAILSIYYMHIGLIKNNLFAIACSGFIISVNVFTRLPNVTLFIFVLAIPFFGYLNTKPIYKSIKPIGVFLFGTLLGLGLITVLLYQLNHMNLLKNSVEGLVDLGKTAGSTHNVGSLFKTYIHNYKAMITVFCKLLIICGFVIVFNNFFKKKHFKRLVNLLGFAILLYLFRKGNIHIVYALGYLGTIGILLTKQKNINIKIIALLALLMLAFLPLGSGGGMFSSGYMCIWLAIPLFLHFLSQIKEVSLVFKMENSIVSSLVSKLNITTLSVLIIGSFFAARIYGVSQEAYFDYGSRLEKIYHINSKFTKGIYTTKRRANIINDLLENLNLYTSAGDYLLVYDKIPMIHFLTETKPYMYNPWPWIYDSYTFDKKLASAEKEHEDLPVVVLQKFETIGVFSEPIPDYMSENKEDSYLYDKERVKSMNRFLSRNRYEIIWSNEYFNIYKASESEL